MEENKKSTNISQKPKLPSKPVPPKPLPKKPVESKTQEQIITEEIIENNENLNDNLTEHIENKKISNKFKQPKKEKKQKPSDVKDGSKTKKSKKKLIIFLVSLILILAIAGGITAAVLINNANNKKLITPTLQVVKLQDSIVLKSSTIENSTKYEFVMVNGNGVSSSYFSINPEYELPKEANQPGQFSFKVRAHGKGAGALSDFSETKTITNYKKLQAPVVNVEGLSTILDDDKIVSYKTNDSLSDDYLSWQKVENAVSYEIYYGVDYSSGEGKLLKEIYTPAQTDTTIKFALSTIYNKRGAGLYNISVVAVPSQGTYHESSMSAIVKDIEYYAKQDKVENAKYDKATKILTFNLRVNSNYNGVFDLLITASGEEKNHKIYTSMSDQQELNGIITFTLSLEQIDNGIDITNMSIVTLSSGAYSSNSDTAVVEILI